MKRLGYKCIKNSLLYTQLVPARAVADGVEEAKKLIEAGFEYVCTHGNQMLFRKRK